MKAVWISWILLVALLVLVFGNAIYVRKTANRLTQLTEQLSTPSANTTTLSSLEELWQKERDRIGISVGFRELDHMDEALINLRQAHKSNDAQEFERQRLLLINAIEEIARAEQNTWKSLF